MEHKDISAVHKLLTEYLKHFHLTPIMSREEVEHWFLPQENIIDTFVVEVREQEQDGGGRFWEDTGRWELLQGGAFPSWAAPSLLAGSSWWHWHVHNDTGKAPQRL